MIKLPGGYAAKADGRGYSLCKMYVRGKDVKAPLVPGEEYPIEIGWYHGMTGVCKACTTLLQRESVESGAVTTLQEAAREFRRIQAQIEALVFPGEGST